MNEPTTPPPLSSIIAAHLHRNGLSTNDFAVAIGYSQKVVSRLLRDRSALSFEVADAIEKVYPELSALELLTSQAAYRLWLLRQPAIPMDEAVRRKGRRRHDIDEQQIVADYRSGKSMSTTAELHDCSVTVVDDVLTAWKVPKRARGRPTARG